MVQVHMKWTRQPEFESWTKYSANTSEKGMNLTILLQDIGK